MLVRRTRAIRLFTLSARRRQSGFTLIETMVALAVGLVVTAAMLSMMSNTLGTGTRTIAMTRLQQELRTALQFMTRDVRRSAYNAEAIRCFANLDCASDGTFANGLTGDVVINAANDCLLFEMDRNHDGDPTNDAPGGYRLVRSGGIGRIQMWTGASDTTCTSTSANWIDVTDPDLVDVGSLLICSSLDSSDLQCDGLLPDGSADPDMPSELSFSEVVDDDGAGHLKRQRTRKLYIRMSARLIRDPDIEKTLADVIRLRNDIIVGS